MSKLSEAMEKRGVTSYWDLNEFDAEWVNPATRADIQAISDKHNGKVFGLHFWDWNKFRGKDLLDCGNFSVDLIFKDEDEPLVNTIIELYKDHTKNTGWATQKDKKCIDALHELALDSCLWV